MNTQLIAFVVTALASGWSPSRILLEAELETGEPREAILATIHQHQQP